MKSKKDVIKGVVKPTSISPRSNFTDPNDPWSAKNNVAENITSRRANLLQQFYKSKGWNVNYISKNKKVAQSKTGEYEKWKRDHGIYEEDQIDEVSNELLGRYKTAAGQQASQLDKAGGRENIQKANKRFSGIVKATKKQFANDTKQGVAEGAPELLKQEMPLVRHIEKELAKHGYEKGTPEHEQMFKHTMSMYRKFGNVDAIKRGVAEGSSYKIDQDDHDEFTPDEIVRIKNSHFPDTLRDNLRAAKKEARRAKHFSSSSNGGDSNLGSPVGSASNNTHEGVAEGKEEIENNHWYDSGVKDATRGARPKPRTYLPTLKDKQAKHPEEIHFYMSGYKSVKQGVAEAKDAGEYDYEGAMAKTQLQTICRNAEALRDMLKDDENLPEWVQAKITKAEDYITTSLDYLKSTDELEEDVGDPKAAEQSPADGANGGEEIAPPRKSVKRIVKEFYTSARQVQEDLYDWEKDDKAAKPYGKKPSVKKYDGVENIGDNKPNARLILKGGKTLTGEPRDTIELDPMMKNRSKMPDYKSMDKIKQKPQEQ